MVGLAVFTMECNKAWQVWPFLWCSLQPMLGGFSYIFWCINIFYLFHFVLYTFSDFSSAGQWWKAGTNKAKYWMKDSNPLLLSFLAALPANDDMQTWTNRSLDGLIIGNHLLFWKCLASGASFTDESILLHAPFHFCESYLPTLPEPCRYSRLNISFYLIRYDISYYWFLTMITNVFSSITFFSFSLLLSYFLTFLLSFQLLSPKLDPSCFTLLIFILSIIDIGDFPFSYLFLSLLIPICVLYIEALCFKLAHSFKPQYKSKIKRPT